MFSAYARYSMRTRMLVMQLFWFACDVYPILIHRVHHFCTTLHSHNRCRQVCLWLMRHRWQETIRSQTQMDWKIVGSSLKLVSWADCIPLLSISTTSILHRQMSQDWVPHLKCFYLLPPFFLLSPAISWLSHLRKRCRQLQVITEVITRPSTNQTISLLYRIVWAFISWFCWKLVKFTLGAFLGYKQIYGTKKLKPNSCLTWRRLFKDGLVVQESRHYTA